MKGTIKFPWRKNILYLMTFAYATVLAIFIALAASPGMTTGQAFDVMEGPLMALLGGTLAISKDLIADDDNSAGPKDGLDNEGKNNQE